MAFSSPNEENEGDDISYILRITPPTNDIWFDRSRAFLEQHFFEYVVAEELSKDNVYHLHAVIKSDRPVCELRKLIRDQLVYVMYPAPRPHGFGSQYNFQKSTDPDKAVTYAVKQKKYYYNGYTEEYIQSMADQSFDPSTRSGFAKDFALLKKNFHESHMTIEQFMDHFNQLKSKHDQMINLTHAYQYALAALVKRDPTQSLKLVQSYLKKNSF